MAALLFKYKILDLHCSCLNFERIALVLAMASWLAHLGYLLLIAK